MNFFGDILWFDNRKLWWIVFMLAIKSGEKKIVTNENLATTYMASC
jgi:hypothetical protein